MYGRRAVAGRRVQLRGVLAERAAEDVELPRERVRAAAERRRVARLQQAALRHHDVQQRIEAVVEEDLGIVDHDQVDPDEHLEHALGEVEVDRAERLRVGARPVEEGVVALAPDRQLHLERAVAEAVVVDVVLEASAAPPGSRPDQRASSPRTCGRAAPAARPGRSPCRTARRARCTRCSPARQPATIANRSARFISGRRTLLRISRSTSSCTTPRSMILSGGMMIPSSKIVRAPVGSEPGERAAGIHLVAELARPADELVLVEDRHEHEPVVRVRDRAPST